MKNTKKKLSVSVIIPVFNGASYLVETVESVQKSSLENFEIILVDDGSKDKSKTLCHRLEKKYKNVHFYWFKKNKGLASSLNHAVKKAKGKFIARINQDDIMMPKRLKEQVKFLEENQDHVVVGGNVTLFDEQYRLVDNITFPKTDADIRTQWLLMSPYADPTVMYRKDAYMKTKGYQKYFWPADDIHMWYQLGQVGKLANIDKVLTRVRWHNKAGSIASHRIQMEKTFEVHVWASKNVQKAKFYHWLFWFGQLIAGKIFPPRLNWFVYRRIREAQNLFREIKKTAKLDKVTNQPKRYSVSGV
ncbi:glycosyltransferase [Patescibacteria group bacterium]|nr:glycosyltransferase [Patescibacteria group bacterium]